MPIEGKRILVAGAAGFVGTNFIKRLVDVKDCDVLGVYNTNKPIIEANNISCIHADLRNLDECKRVVKDADYVCMFAGRLSTVAVMSQNPLGPVADNTVINVNMLDAAYSAGVKRYLWLSSTTGYPEMDHQMTEEDFFVSDPPPPYEPVGWMSRYIEKLSTLYATKSRKSMTVISLRPTAIFGEYDDFNYETCHALPAIMRRVIERHSPIEIWGTGKDERDWLYVDDLIDACLLALEKIEGNEAINIGSGKTYSLNQLLAYTLKIDGYQNAKVVKRFGKSRKAHSRRFDCSRAERLLGFRAKTPIEEGLANTIKWYKDNNIGNDYCLGSSARSG